ncbi:hypothetical protein [Ciceribacter sp. L1K22]|uniref:hypothetical protein n=1 Tax=Ciceribacter sp. L1K22 TaxID=2820275 RepID=UPI001ABE741E|nr:hypothetical protein [Ciceribacter sp. L1K22]MBO3759870.1 hypothetical protein [Ciceribacter sp. L1K22]
MSVREQGRRFPTRAKRGFRLLALFCSATILAAIVTAAALTVWPDPLFAYSFRTPDINLHSDRPIPPEAMEVLMDVRRRLERSELPPSGPHDVYICNDTWKLNMFGRNASNRFGGISDVYLAGNIFIRPSDIGRNAIFPPASWRFSLADRPLSYFIAHEITHLDEVAALGRLAYWRTPAWLLEGYADHIGKGSNVDRVIAADALRREAPQMDPRNGVYNRYQLAVELLLERSSFMELAAAPPDPEKALHRLLGVAYN